MTLEGGNFDKELKYLSALKKEEAWALEEREKRNSEQYLLEVSFLETEVRPLLERINQEYLDNGAEISTSYDLNEDKQPDNKPTISLGWEEESKNPNETEIHKIEVFLIPPYKKDRNTLTRGSIHINKREVTCDVARPSVFEGGFSPEPERVWKKELAKKLLKELSQGGEVTIQKIPKIQEPILPDIIEKIPEATHSSQKEIIEKARAEIARIKQKAEERRVQQQLKEKEESFKETLKKAEENKKKTEAEKIRLYTFSKITKWAPKFLAEVNTQVLHCQGQVHDWEVVSQEKSISHFGEDFGPWGGSYLSSTELVKEKILVTTLTIPGLVDVCIAMNVGYRSKFIEKGEEIPRKITSRRKWRGENLGFSAPFRIGVIIFSLSTTYDRNYSLPGSLFLRSIIGLNDPPEKVIPFLEESVVRNIIDIHQKALL